MSNIPNSININNITKNINFNKIHYATSLTNYVKNDTIIDYLNILNKNDYIVDVDDNLNVRKRKREKYETNNNLSINNNINNNHTKTSFDYIVEQGHVFEKNIIDTVCQKMHDNYEQNNIFFVNEKLNLKNKYKKTLKILSDNKYDIIFGAFLFNNNNNTGGYPDIIVKGKWINKYITKKYDVNQETYYIIDIKSSVISLINKGKNMSEMQIFNNYKMQVYVYTEALNNMLFLLNTNYKKINIGFLLGKKYTYVIDNVQQNFNSFEMLGQYEFNKYNKNDEINLKNASEWLLNVNNNWNKMTLNPINDDNLYPNMKNTYDGKYKKIKSIIAEENKEITMLYYCGIQHRKNAFKNGIKTYDNVNLTTDILGFNEKSSIGNILTKMLILNKSDENILLTKDNNYMNWQQQVKYEFFVDFETRYDFITEKNSLYMIGVGYIDNTNDDTNNKNTFIYNSFVIKHNNSNINSISDINDNANNNANNYLDNKNITNNFCENEHELIKNFTAFISNINNCDHEHTRLYHWSCFESVTLKSKSIEHNVAMQYNLNWFDLLNVFKDKNNPIIIKNCHSFGLKKVIEKLNKYKYINLNWNDLDDGLLSSFIASDIYNGKTDANKMFEIIEYNYVDCYALYVLLNFIRDYIDGKNNL